MHDFVYHNTAKIIFGKNAMEKLGSEAALYGKAMLVMGGGSVRENGVFDKTVAALKESGVEYCQLWGVKPNPDISKVREGVRMARNEGVSLILAVGGGSVIDTAKAIAAGVPYDGDPWDFYGSARAPEIALPVGVVLTIPAAGSESSMSSVISNGETKEKLGCTAECFLPRFAVMDPQNTFTLPAYQTACGASDMLSHLMERYFVTTECCDLTDRLIEGAAQTVIEFAPRAIADPENYDVRAELMWTGCIAHCDILDRGRGEGGRGGDWASHQLEHQLSAFYDIAHGAGLSIIFPAWLKYVSGKNPSKPAQFGRRVFGITGLSDEETAEKMISALEDFYRSLSLPVRLSKIGIGSENFGEMAKRALAAKNGRIGSYIRLTEEDIKEIYTLAE
ncbi:MAG: iron-containing alcohol dehydrogenase [Oscillospiraceae bacterium]|nr:iron-containing alcohol dehydrogenase [Oscillospiraceae bacterium]